MSAHTPKSATIRGCNPTSAKSTESPKPIPTNVGADQADRQGNSTSPGHASNADKGKLSASGNQRGLPSFGPTEGNVNVAVNRNTDSSHSTIQTATDDAIERQAYADGDFIAGLPNRDTPQTDTAFYVGTAIAPAVNSVFARTKNEIDAARLIAAAPDLLAALEALMACKEMAADAAKAMAACKPGSYALQNTYQKQQLSAWSMASAAIAAATQGKL